jgi:ribosomal protein S18 acetylase RimI-like enzyme
MKLMKIIYKPCRKKDLIPAFKMIRTSLNHLRKSTGKEVHRYQIRRLIEAEHLYETDRHTIWCAWAGNNIIGFAAALMRGKQWYLAFLFVHPRYQDKGVGRKLLEKVWRDGKGYSHSLSTFAYNMQAVGIYGKFGMAPLCTLPIMQVTLDKLTLLKPTNLTMRTRPTQADIAWINRLEAKIRGYSRPQEWRFWPKFGEVQINIFEHKGRRVGYSLVYAGGGIAPAGAISNDFLVKVVAETIRHCKPKRHSIRICCPTHNINLYRFLMESGFRLMEMDLFLSDIQYPDFQRYVPAQLAIF